MPSQHYQNIKDIGSATGQTIAQYYNENDLDNLEIVHGYMQSPLFGKSDYDRVELHVYDASNKYLLSTHEAEGWNISTDEEGTPTADLSYYKNLIDLGFINGTFTTVYNFHRDVVGRSTGPKFKVHSISKDRTEVRIIPTDVEGNLDDSNPELEDFYSRYQKLKSTSAVQGPYNYAAIPNNPLWTQIQINFGYNKIHTATSWLIDDIFPPDPDEPHTILLKLYNPLPKDINLTDRCWLVAEATQPVINKVLLDVPALRCKSSLAGPNFDLCLDTTPRVQTGYRSYDQLLGDDKDVRSEILNSYSSSLDGAKLNIDYACFENYTHFSSAEKRIDNFVYKLKLISGYDKQAQKFDYSDHAAQDIYIYEYTGSLGTKYVKQYIKRWVDRKVKLINEFDDFEKWLYFESGSVSKYITSTGSRGGGEYDWSRSVITPYPKLSGSLKNDLWTEDYYDWSLDQLFDWAVHAIFIPGPNYELLNVTHSKSTNWHTTAIASASAYDKQNSNLLRKAVPEFIGDSNKDANDTYLNFLDLTGQAHDIWWTYTKHFTDISNRHHNENYDNKIGMSDDIVYHIANASGMRLTEGDPNQELWKYKLGKTAEGTRLQNSPTGSIRTLTNKQRTVETWRRIVNNLPFLLKTKGTKIGTRGLINCYGIPEHILPIYEYGSSKKSEQSTLFEQSNFKYCLNFHKSQSISTYWGPHDKTRGKITSSAITPNVVEFRTWPYPNIKTDKQSLWQVNNDMGVILHRSHSSVIKPNGQPESYTEYGHFSLIMSSSLADGVGGYYSASTGKAKIFESSNTKEQGNGWWTIMLSRKATSSDPIPGGVYHSSSKFTYELVAMRGEYGVIDQAVSASFGVTGSFWSSSFNDTWSGSLQSNKRAHLGGRVNSVSNPSDIYGGHENHALFGEPFSGSMQELRYYARPISQSVLQDHTLSPEMYSSNVGINTYDDLLARYKLSDEANHFTRSIFYHNASSSVNIESLHPDQRTGSRNWNNNTFELRATANNFPNKNYYGYVEENYYTNTPEAGPNSYTSDKVRYEENKLLRHLSPTSRAEKPTSDKYSLDSNKLGIYFSPTDQINKDIFDHIGGLPLDNYLGDPREEFEDSYSELKHLNRKYWKKYTDTQNKQTYLDELKLYDMSLFTMLKRMLPARANADLGVVIQPHFIERAKLPSRGKIQVQGDTKVQNIATNASSFIKYKHPTTIVNVKTQVKQTGFNLQPQTITGKLGGSLTPPKGLGTSAPAQYNSILKGFSAMPQQSTLAGQTNFAGRSSPKENSTTINGVIGAAESPIIILSDQTIKSTGTGVDRITQVNSSNVVSHTGVQIGSFETQLAGTVKVRSLRNVNGVTKTPYSHTSIIKSGSDGAYITASTPTYKAEATSSHICAYRRSEYKKVASYFYTTAKSASRGKGYETGGSNNRWAYSQSLKWAEVQDYNITGTERAARLRYKGAQLTGPDFNVDSKFTIDHGPVVSFTIGDPNTLISSDAGFGGNLSIE